MAKSNVPATKSTIILDKLIQILFSERTFEGCEEFEFRKDLKPFPQGDLIGDQLWAFFYACKGDVSAALSLFEKSFSYNEPYFMMNYITYLFDIGFIKKHIAEIIRANNQISNSSNFLIHLFDAYLWNGNFEGINKVYQELDKLNKKDVISGLSQRLDSLRQFQTNLKLSDENMQFLLKTFLDIADTYRLSHSKICCEYYPDDDINIMILTTNDSDFVRLAKIDGELADKIAENKHLHDKAFGVSIRYLKSEYRVIT